MTPRGNDPTIKRPVSEITSIRLDILPRESCAEILEVPSGQGTTRKLAELGIAPGATVQVRRHAPLGGPILLEVQGTMVALGRKLAHKVLVRKLQ